MLSFLFRIQSHKLVIFNRRIAENVVYSPLAYNLSCFIPQTEKLVGMKLQPEQLQLALSNNIKKYRKEQGLSQERLALMSGIDRSYMSEIERCRANLSIDLLLKISNALKMPPSKLLEL